MTTTMPEASTSLNTATRWLEDVREDLTHVEQKMRQAANMGDTRLDMAVSAIIAAGGKRMRPALTVLAGRLFGAPLQYVYSVGASIELLHTATLIHDDLIDGAQERRGTPTLHSQLSNGITVLTGDFVFAQSAALASEANSVRIVRLFSETLVRICRGEILQAQTRWQIPTQSVYEERIYGKTAALFEAASTAGAMLGGALEEEIAAMGRFGRALGLAFQIVDDALDFLSTTEQLGKPAGHDMRQGIFNLPVLFYAQEGHITEQELLHRLETGEDLDGLVADINAAGMVEKSLAVAREHARTAARILAEFSNGLALNSLQNLSDYVLARTY
jgi:geranylgeranyl pyrophosphate synthase